MKNQTLPRLVSPRVFFLGSLFMLLCLLLPARAQSLALNANIGSPVVGADSYNSTTGTYTIAATAMGLMNGGVPTSDAIPFVYAQTTGDVELAARVTSFSGPDGSQVGLTMRTGLGVTDQMASGYFIHNYNWGSGTLMDGFLGPMRGPTVDGNLYYYQYICGAWSMRPSLTPPFWLKMVRVGNNYGVYWSVNGKDWVQMSGLSGGAFFATGTYNIGFFIGSASTSTGATATLDNVYLGPPRLKYKSSRVGCTSEGLASGFPGNNIYSLWVKPSDGTCYTNSNWAENSTAGRVYKDGKLFHTFFSDPGINGAQEGTVTGNGSNIFYYNAVGTPKVFRADFTTANYTPLTFNGTPLGEVRGLAASATTLFVSDYANGLVRAVDLTQPTPTEITTGNFPIALPRCGPIVYDGTNFWVIQAATQDPTGVALSSHTAYVGSTRPSIRCYQPDGTPLPSRTISWTDPDTCIPTALAYQDLTPVGTTSANDVLWVCDNGPHQYIRCYTNLTGGTPTAATPFGQDGGLWAGSHPGQITDSAAGGDRRFYGLTGVGTDSSGYIYVACNGADGSTTDLRKFNSSGTLQWRVNGLLFLNNGDFDPSSDGQDYYTTEKHFTMNYANTAPGTEWSYKGFTNDIRNNAGSRDYGGSKLARIGSNLYMYTYLQGNVGIMRFYCFNGDTATLFGSNAMDGTAPNINHIWTDMNLNGIDDAGDQDTSAPQSLPGGTWMSFDVDTSGDIWMCSQGSIRQVVNQGTQTVTNGTISNVVPKYSLAAGNYNDYPIPTPLVTATQINYDRTNDVLYLVGQTGDGTWMLERTDKWMANPESKNSTANATWAVKLTPQTDITMLYPPPAEFSYFGLDLAGGKLFVSEIYAPIHVYDAALGNPEITLVAGPEISSVAGWDDMTMGISAFKRSTGEYVVTEENAGIGACGLLYRWTPSADSAVTTAPVLTAAPSGRKVVLTWAGPTGMVTSYKLYRGTTSGGETLYQSGIASPVFTDLNVTAGTTYYYKVTAVNAAGESAQSNEVSATPAASQAEYVKTDTTTKGDWYTGTMPSATYVYGSEGYDIAHTPSDTASLPSYVTSATPATYLDGNWDTDPSSDVRSLRIPNSPNRTSATRCCGYGLDSWTWSVTFNDSKWHQVSVYCSYWAGANNCKVDVLDASTGTVIDSRQVGTCQQGKWLVWNVCGNINFRFDDGNQSFASGIFFDPVKVTTPAIAWWKFDETSGTTAADSSGAGHNGTVSGTTWDPSGPVHLNGCVKIPGGTARVNLPNSLITGHVPISMSAWFKTSSTTGAAIAGYANAASSPTHWDPVLYVGTDGKLRGTFYDVTTNAATLSSTTTVNNGAWHHVALVADGSVQALYLDGNIVGYRAGTLSATALPYNYLGYANVSGWPSMTGTTNNFNGWLDDVRIYDKALTASQIYQLAHP